MEVIYDTASYLFNFASAIINNHCDAKCKEIIYDTYFKLIVNTISTIEFYLPTTLPILESLILTDGLMCAGFFVKDYFLLKLSEKRVGKSSKVILEYKMDILKKYGSLYTLDTIDRYLFYSLSYCNFKILTFMFETKSPLWGVAVLSLAVPVVQNKIMKLFHNPLNYYIENKIIFVKYSVSKLLVSSFQVLHKDIDKIDNYHIFLIYNILSFDYLYTCLRNYFCVTLMYVLKRRQALYYYYKAIKTALYFNTGYNFEAQSLYDSVYLANLIVKEERWNELSKMEVVNMLYVLIDSKFSDPNSSIYVTSYLFLLQFFSLWTFVSVLPLFDYSSIILIFSTLLFLSILYGIQSKTKKLLTLVISYCLLLFNVNVIIATVILISNNIVYYILGELYFFITNISSIRKVVKAYNKKKKPKLNINITETEKEFIFVNGK
jgi:hypothetical protein